MIIKPDPDTHLLSDYIYKPDVDGQELIEKLKILVVHEMRWNGLFDIWDRYPHEVVYEAIIAYSAQYVGYIEKRLPTIIMTCGFHLIPYAQYRRDNPPQGEWGNTFESFFIQDIARHYKQACDIIIDASNRELLRD